MTWDGIRRAASWAEYAASACVLAVAIPAPAPARRMSPCQGGAGLHRLAVHSTPQSNGGRPTAIDLVFVSDRRVADVIGKLRASDYFPARGRLARDFGTGWRFQQWELQAGQALTLAVPKPPCRLVATFIFVQYRGAGEFRLKLGTERRGTLVLGRSDVRWVPDAR